MGRGTTARVMVRRVVDDEDRSGPDQLIVEEPLEIRLDGNLVATTMRTPGHDFELAVGLCVGDGLLGGASVLGVTYCDGPCGPGETTYNTVTVATGGRAPVPTPRVGTVGSACGVCGSTSIDDLALRLAPLPGPVPALDGELVQRVVEAAREASPLYAATGASHAAASFDLLSSAVGVVREDIGRHNAVDKVVGRLALDGGLPSGEGLYVSGRASFEMVQKAWAGGFRALVAVSGPSALAVQTARRAGLVLVGFARDGRWNVYSPDPLRR